MKKIKKLVIVAIVLVVLLVGLIGFAAMNAGSIVRSFQPQLEQVASDAMKAKVTLGNLDLSLFPATRIEVEAFNVAPKRGDGKGISLSNLFLDVDLVPLLTGELVITKLALDRPSITMIKDADGFYIEGLPKGKKAPAAGGGKKAAKKQAAKTPAQKPSVPINVNLDRFEITNASITLKDTVAGKEYPVTGINVDSRFSLTDNNAVLPNLNVSARVMDQADLQLSARTLEYGLQTGNVSVPALSVEVNCKTCDGPIKLDLAAELKDNRAQLKELNITGFSGKIDGNFMANLVGAQDLAAQLGITGVDIGSLVRTVKPDLPVKVSGTLDKVALDIKGNQGSNLMTSLDGNAALAIVDGKIEEVNLAGDVLRAIANLPFLQESLYEQVPEEEKAELDADGTVLKNLSGDFAISNGRLTTDNLSVVSMIFDLQGAGSVGMDSSVDLEAEILFKEGFSKVLATAVKELEGALNEEGRLALPIKITGTAPAVSVKPDTKKLAKLAVKAAVKQKAKGAVEKLLKKKMGDESGGGADELTKGLGNILGF